MITSEANTGPFLEAFALISEFERQRATARWRYSGFEVWPIVKYVLVKQLMASMSRGYGPPESFEWYKTIAQKNRLPKRRFWDRRQSQPNHTKTLNHLPLEMLQSCPYWCIGAGRGLFELGSDKVSQHHHALRTALIKKGHQSVGLYYSHDSDKYPELSAYGPNFDINGFVKHVARNAGVPEICQSHLEPRFKGLDIVVSTAGHPIDHLFALADNYVGRVEYSILCFESVLEIARPKAIFTTNYASFFGWALAHVCRRYNVPFVDIQHGIEGRYNGAYYFEQTPKNDWSLLPTRHLCWSQSDADLFSSQHEQRKATVVGPTWQQVAPFLSSQTQEEDKAISALKSREGPLILYAAQSAEDVFIARELRAAGLNVAYREHPRRRGEAEKLVGLHESEELLCKFASDAPLPTLLRSVDAIVTGYSSVLIEAALQGIPILATSDYASLLTIDYHRELDGLITIRPAQDVREKTKAALSWVKDIEKGPRRRAASNLSLPEALSCLDIPM